MIDRSKRRRDTDIDIRMHAQALLTTQPARQEETKLPSGWSNMRLLLFSSAADKLKIKSQPWEGKERISARGYGVRVCSALCWCKYWVGLNEPPCKCTWAQPTAEFGPGRL